MYSDGASSLLSSAMALATYNLFFQAVWYDSDLFIARTLTRETSIELVRTLQEIPGMNSLLATGES